MIRRTCGSIEDIAGLTYSTPPHNTQYFQRLRDSRRLYNVRATLGLLQVSEPGADARLAIG